MIIIGSDHTGIDLKKQIITYLNKNKVDVQDVTSFVNQEGDDYPDVAYSISKKVLEYSNNLGIAICGTGIGICISCNKVVGIRAALCTDEYMSEMSRRHNNANVLCLGARTSAAENKELIEKMVDKFINTSFEGGRHEKRIDKIASLESNSSEGRYTHDS
ncbi:putative ribose-5-phosphate isomerase B [compost metagenome]